MSVTDNSEEFTPRPNAFVADDVLAILQKRGWFAELSGDPGPTDLLRAWCARAAELLGPHVPDHEALEELLTLVFRYDAAEILQQSASQEVIVRSGSREVIRQMANRILDGGELDSNHFKELVDGIKAAVPFRSRVIFHPIRLALAGRNGEGELDRVILLLDAAANVPFTVKVKSTRERMLEFCAALD